MRRVSFIGNHLKNLTYLVIMGLVISLLQGPLFVSASNVQPKTVKIGYYENEIFQEGASEDAVKSGYAYEYYMKLSEYTGWRYEYVYGSFNDLYQMLIDGDIDMLAGLAYKEDRADLMGYPDLAMGTESYNLVKYESNREITSDVESLQGHSIGVLDSAMADALDEYLERNNVDADVVRYEYTDELTEDFEAGVVDVLAVEGEGTNKRSGYEVLLTFGMTDYYICVSNSRGDLLKELNDAQTDLFNDEPYYTSSLSSKYHGSSVSAQALSSVERAWLDNNDSLTVGYLNNYLPYSSTDVYGNVTGVIRELMPAIFNAVDVNNISVSYVGYDTYEDMITAINNEEIDVAFPVGGGIYHSEQNGIYQTEPIVSISTELVFDNVVVNPSAAKFAVNSSNSMQYYYIKTYYPDAEIVYYDNIEQCLEAVMKHEVDCTTLNGLRAGEILKNYKYNRLSVRQLSEKDGRCLGVKIGNDGLLRLLNRGINILADDYSESIAYKYTKDLYNYSFIDWLDDYLVGVLVIIVLIVVASVIILHIRTIRKNRVILALRNSNKNQLVLIENIARSIKEPITEIHNLSSMASQAMDDEKLISDCLKKIEIDSANIQTTAGKIIDASILDKGRLILNKEKVNVAAFAREIEGYMQPKADSKGINYSVKTKNIKTKDVMVDRERLMQALMAVIDNSLKFTGAGGNIKFTVEEQPCGNMSMARLVFTIKDDGTGMSDEFKAIAFDAFTKEENALDANLTGVGLGLTITKKLVELMGGYITLMSKKNLGTEVTITLDCKISYN